MTRARISVFAAATAAAARASMPCTNPADGAGAGQRRDQLGAPVHRDRMGDHQVHTPRLQVRPVGDRARRARARSRRRGAADLRRSQHRTACRSCWITRGAHQRDLHLLMAEPATPRSGAARPAPRRTGSGPAGNTATRSSGLAVPGQMRTRRPRLLALPARAIRPPPGPRLRPGRGPAGHPSTAGTTNCRYYATPAAPAAPPSPAARRSQPAARRSRPPAPRSPRPAPRMPGTPQAAAATWSQATIIRTIRM